MARRNHIILILNFHTLLSKKSQVIYTVKPPKMNTPYNELSMFERFFGPPGFVVILLHGGNILQIERSV